MRLCSYTLHGRPGYGVVAGDRIVDLRARLPRLHSWSEVLRAGALEQARAASAGVRGDIPLAEVQLLPPLDAPEKILCIGINYANRSADYNEAEPPKYPSMFFRVPGSFVGHDRPLVRPLESEQLDYEGEIAIVIGRGGRRIAADNALSHIMGVTLCNEGTIRDWIRHGKFNVTQGKNWDATGSMGPWIVTTDEIDLTQPLSITVRLNGMVTQQDTTDSLLYSFANLIRYVSTFMTLSPGDIIVTGTPVKQVSPEAPRWLRPGDELEIDVPEIGVLRNHVVDERD